ncbi:transposable element Tcb2 transposase [Trichonephila clavipes]|nr:transposable element Tcb2 transposase [Trichonephila clavipes]
MDDNATCHRTLAVQDCLDNEGIQRLIWPARSPDLNPIENVWDALGRQVAGRTYPPTNKNTLIRALTEEWDKLPEQLLDNVVQRRPHALDDEALDAAIKKDSSQTCGEPTRQFTTSSTMFILHMHRLDLTFDNYVLVDTNIVVWGTLSDAEIVALYHKNKESDEDEFEELTPVTLSEAKVSLNKLRNFFLQNHFDVDILQA